MDTSDTPSTIPLSGDLLDRYLAGECSPNEEALVRVYLERDARAEYLLRHADQLSEAPLAAPSAKDGWRALSDQLNLDAHREDVALGRIQRTERPIFSTERSGLVGEQLGRKAAGLRVPHLTRYAAGMAATGLMLCIVMFAVHVGTTKVPVAAKTYTTPVGREAVLTLPDGTRITLASSTTLHVAELSAGGRQIDLENGAVSFEVKHSTEAPFSVRSGQFTTNVLGTAFVVRHLRGESHVHVAVEDGRVRVVDNANARKGVVLSAGFIGDLTDSTVNVTTVNALAPSTEWIDGRLMFHDASVMNVLATLQRWYGYQFRCADSATLQKRINIGLSTRSPAAALAVLENVLRVDLTISGDTITLNPRSEHVDAHQVRLHSRDVWMPTREIGR